MGKIVVTEFMSVDGVMEAPGGEPGYRHTNWVGKYPDAGQFVYKLEETMEHDALLLGRKTYESFAGAWPSWEGEFADKMNSMPKFVVSTTLERAEWNNSTLIKGDVVQAITRLRDEFDGNILVEGSRTLVTTLRKHDLVDEYRLMVFPYVLGSGMRVFDDSEEAKTLELVDVKRFESILLLTYRPVRSEGQS